MNKADEMRAFAQMMVEISDSDSDDGRQGSDLRSVPAVAAPKSQTKSEQKDRKYSGPTANSHYDSKMTAQEEEIENFGWNTSKSVQAVTTPQMEQIGVMKRWLMRPCAPGDPPVLCYVERHRVGFGRINPTYRCFLEGSDGQGPRFLMTAKKKNGSQTSYYLISLDMDDQNDRGSESVLGKVRGNSVGSQYLVTDSGLAPDRTVAPSMLRKVSLFSEFEKVVGSDLFSHLLKLLLSYLVLFICLLLCRNWDSFVLSLTVVVHHVSRHLFRM